MSAATPNPLHTRWPISCGVWEELDERGRPTTGSGVDPPPLLMPLHDMRLASRSSADPAIPVLSGALACGCFGGHHLWEDLGASGRDQVSRLIAVGFPALFDANRRNLRWKRHLFLVLGQQPGEPDLRPPKCDNCDGHEACFGSPVAGKSTPWLLQRRH